ncbi:flagellar biosynthetic protein FliO [Halalkalibacter krulwichiae]|uniref:Flagellar biosynthesis protein, FliO n=1 Tax=Halalkalibacter krulwichiae TaxID=199441 RepID=A0A1X9MC58_9BACI|nr:flagellar biosynthetic protein FliO [Halalkalibacter krulwichiae]ARK30988.1 Flagellar biosynthesis protein, FliO [Halalkalibacter krulwichiae]
MHLRLFIFALVLISLFGWQNHAGAETTDENRRVSETLHGNESVEDEMSNESEEIVDESGIIETDSATDEIIPEQNTFLIFAQMISALALVIVLIYLLLRFVNKRSQSFRSTQMLQNIGGVSLGQSRSVQLVKVGERILVVGVGETIQLLREIDDKKEMELLVKKQQEQFEQLDQPLNKFISFVSGKFTSNKKQEKLKNVPNKANQNEFKDLLEKQLKDLSKSQKNLHDAARERDQ